MKITIDNESGQSVTFHADKMFPSIKILSLGCDECCNKDDVILGTHQIEILKQYLFNELAEDTKARRLLEAKS